MGQGLTKGAVRPARPRVRTAGPSPNARHGDGHPTQVRVATLNVGTLKGKEGEVWRLSVEEESTFAVSRKRDWRVTSTVTRPASSKAKTPNINCTGVEITQAKVALL